MQCTVLCKDNNWTNIDFYVTIIVSFSINRNLYAQLFGIISVHIENTDLLLHFLKTTESMCCHSGIGQKSMLCNGQIWCLIRKTLVQIYYLCILSGIGQGLPLRLKNSMIGIHHIFLLKKSMYFSSLPDQDYVMGNEATPLWHWGANNDLGEQFYPW